MCAFWPRVRGRKGSWRETRVIEGRPGIEPQRASLVRRSRGVVRASRGFEIECSVWDGWNIGTLGAGAQTGEVVRSECCLPICSQDGKKLQLQPESRMDGTLRSEGVMRERAGAWVWVPGQLGESMCVQRRGMGKRAKRQKEQ